MKSGHSIHKRVTHYAHTDIDALYRNLQIPKDGYSEEQVERGREHYGSNTLTGRVTDTVFFRLRRAFINPFSIIVFVLAGISSGELVVGDKVRLFAGDRVPADIRLTAANDFLKQVPVVKMDLILG